MVGTPIVTGLSPNEGPPGTRITIRGENFGTDVTDLVGLTICGYNCLLSAEWKSSSKIIAMSGPGKGKGDVIVTTRRGGVGSCSVSFKGFHESTGPMKECAVWVEETPFLWGRNSLSASNFHQDDPLGLSVEENEKKIPEDVLIELFSNATSDIASEFFSASWFLLENHHTTSFNDLQAGFLHLRRKVEGQKEGQLSFLKTNVASVIDQVDTLMVIKEFYEKDLGSFGVEPTLKLEKAIRESEREARKLFDDVLTRRDRADKTRNALNVLTRFRFLFCLPCAIDRNIKKGDYDIIINDYMRVKNLFHKRDVPVFKMALKEIEKCIFHLQNILHEKLITLPISIDEQKKLIKYLVNLDSPYEPAWDAIKGYSDYIHKRMKQCYEEHKASETALIELDKSKNISISKYSKYSSSTFQELMYPENVLFVKELCDIVSDLFPDLWKLGQAYFIDELHAKVEPGHKVEFKHMVLNIMVIFCKTLRMAIIPHTLNKSTDKSVYGTWVLPEINIIVSHLPECLRFIRHCYSILIKLDLPSEALDIVLSLILDLRMYCIISLFKKTVEKIKFLEKHENWNIEFSVSQDGITALPIKFEQQVQELIEIINESVLSNEQREGLLLDNVSIQKEFGKQIESLLAAFQGVIMNLTLRENCDDGDDRSPIMSQLIGSSTSINRHTKSNLPIWEHRLLITLANCQYSHNIILSNILDSFKVGGYTLPVHIEENIKIGFENLEKSILESYLEQKGDPLVGTVEPSMYLGRFDWDTNIIPTDIRPYVKECINNLIHVHSEVNSISQKLVNIVLPQVVQTIAEELYRLMSCVQKFSINGIQQVNADISALQDFFSSYSTLKAKRFFEEATQIIPPLQKLDYLIVKEVLNICRLRMRLQALCLQPHMKK